MRSALSRIGMNATPDRSGEQAILHKLTQWGKQQPLVQAMLLTSSRTNLAAPLDALSDYDLIVIVTDIQPYLADETWLEDFGELLVVYRDPVRRMYGYETFTRVTHYQNGTKIDYSIWPSAIMPQITAQPRLPDFLDIGYQILLDKHHLADALQAPTYTAYIPAPPTAEAYTTVIDEFFNDALYVAKYLWRDDLLPAKYSLDNVMKRECLRQMLEWRMEIAHGWSIKPGANGRGLKRNVDPGIWAALERTYVGAEIAANWEALFQTIELFHAVAVAVGSQLGYTYPSAMEQRILAHLSKLRHLDRPAPLEGRS
jgi:aminoglycoside 6-adenylyltransferase